MSHSCRPVQGHKSIIACDVAGRVDAATAPAFRQDLDAFAREGKSKLILSLTSLEFISAAGLNAMLGFAQKAQTVPEPKRRSKKRPREVSIKIVGANPNIRRIMTLAGFDRYFDYAETDQEAIAAFAGSSA